jgi:hypothetical protein
MSKPQSWIAALVCRPEEHPGLSDFEMASAEVGAQLHRVFTGLRHVPLLVALRDAQLAVVEQLPTSLRRLFCFAMSTGTTSDAFLELSSASMAIRNVASPVICFSRPPSRSRRFVAALLDRNRLRVHGNAACRGLDPVRWRRRGGCVVLDEACLR